MNPINPDPVKQNPEIFTDAELRAMRDAIYAPEQPSQVQCDASWMAVRANWRRDASWLAEQCRKMEARDSRAGRP